MAPNKIFLQVCGSCNIDDVTCENCEFAKLLEGGEVTWSEDRIYEKDEEYIRKDALLEWAKEQRKDCERVIREHPQDESLWCERDKYEELIDKIESL